MVDLEIAFVLVFLSFTLCSVNCEVAQQALSGSQNNLHELLARSQLKLKSIRHSIGTRKNGDVLIGNFGQPVTNFTSPKNVQQGFFYPNGVPNNKIISYIAVEVIQSSTQGKVIIQNGGIGQTQVSGIAYANQTMYFGINAQVYGYDNASDIKRHGFGQRKKGDVLIGTFSQGMQKYPLPTNASMDFVYPKKGVTNSKRITFIQVEVTQSSGLSRVIIQSGGPGQKNVSGTVYADRTMYFGVNGQIYGYSNAIAAKTCAYLFVLSILMTLL